MDEAEAAMAVKRMEDDLAKDPSVIKFYNGLVDIIEQVQGKGVSLQSRAFLASWVRHVDRLTETLGHDMLKLVPETQAYQAVILGMALAFDAEFRKNSDKSKKN